jgi:hypothetical protein
MHHLPFNITTQAHYIESGSFDYVFGCRLGGVTVSVLTIGLKIRGLKPVEDNGFLRAIKLRSTPSFGGEVKLKATAQCHKSSWNVKEPFKE